MLGYAEELEFFATLPAEAFHEACGLAKVDVVEVYERNARDTADHFIDDVTSADGITYWDDGAPGMSQLGDWRERGAEPHNAHEPVDSGAAAIAAQGLLRLGRYLDRQGGDGSRYFRGGLTAARTLFSDPYLAPSGPGHQGILLHNVYHRPNGWDHVPAGQKGPLQRVGPVGRLPPAGTWRTSSNASARMGLLIRRSTCDLKTVTADFADDAD